MTVLEINEIIKRMQEIPDFDFGPVNVASTDVLREAYNGCGPDRWPKGIRDMLDETTAMYAPAVAVHDLEFYLSDLDYAKMNEANERFHRNTKAIFSHDFPLMTWKMLRPSYRLRRAKAHAVMLVLNVATTNALTRKAWKEAFMARMNRENGTKCRLG